MRKMLSLIVLFAPALALSQELVRFQPEPDFDLAVNHALQAAKPNDAFQAASECGVIDARYVAPVPIEKAEKILGDCLSALATRYGGADLLAKRGTVTRDEGFTAQVEVLMILVPKSVGAATPLMRDLNHALAQRQGRILGHRAVIERADDRKVSMMSSTPQNALDNCMLPSVVRKIESGADFIKYYGSCLRQARSLRVVDMRQSPAHRLGVILLTEADRAVAETLTGPVKVAAANGPVEVQLLAYTNPVHLP